MQFDPDTFRIMYVPTVRVDAKMTDADYGLWTTRISQLISRRLDRKGLIHTVSFPRRDRLVRQSRFKDIMDSNYDGDITAKVVDRFKIAEPPKVLVSPSVTTGYDFPGDSCEYQILGKVPFPDPRGKLNKARQERDREYSYYVAMQGLMQAIGRIHRGRDDQSESFIIDDHFAWFIERYGHLAPRWFHSFLKTSNQPPEPLPKLQRRHD
jgi:ATP-dependent DNA helicase DinG